MCSIAGSKNGLKVEKMLDMMRHRSPDMIVYDPKYQFCLGMGRLSILDIHNDNLCLYSENNLILSFNGEIYNYIEIRRELKKYGYKFTTKSDTEVLLKSYIHWGLDMFDKFNGMYAFAIYDTKKQKILIARDIAGEKPLYYNDNNFEFSSEAKALNFDCVELQPAHYLLYDVKKDKIGKQTRYWIPKKVEISKDPIRQLEKLLADSVKLRTRSDVPYGLYYSGGVDSSLISTFHDFKHKFTYKDKDNSKEFRKIFPKILWHLDYPVKSFSPFGLWKLAEEASKKVKVIISGEGADELFGGYIRFVGKHFNYLAQKEFPSYKGMFNPAESVTEQGWKEFNGNMRELLRMGDRMSAAFGIENRCVFLDKRIIEFALSLPDEWKINGLDTKVILRKILHKRNPKYKEIEKIGLFCNVNKWIKSKQTFEKDDYLRYQEKIWQKLFR